MALERWNSKSSSIYSGKWPFRRSRGNSAEKTRTSVLMKTSQVSIPYYLELLTGMKGKVENNLPLRLGMSVYRRKHLINAIMGKSDRSKTEGKLIMNKFQ